MSSPELPDQHPRVSESEPANDSMTGLALDRHRLVVGAVLCGIGVSVGLIALVCCCYSFGADFRGEGWGDPSTTKPEPDRMWLVLSLIGFAVSIPLFWVGFFRIVHSATPNRGT